MGLISFTLILDLSIGAGDFPAAQPLLPAFLRQLGKCSPRSTVPFEIRPFALSRPADCGLRRAGDSVTSLIFKTLSASRPEVLLGPRPGQGLVGSGGQIEVWRFNKACLRNFRF